MSALPAIDVEERLEKVEKVLKPFKLPSEIAEIKNLTEYILKLKKTKNALILGHNYMTPEVFHGISDFTGDSLGLSRHAAESDADIILFNGVHFMAETAKILNPSRKVLIADLEAGCSLAEAITAQDIQYMRSQYPGVPVVTYINCTAAVKAECDIVCTSANAIDVVNSLDSDRVIMVPDGYLAANVQKKTEKEIIIWAGKCMVHELYSATDVDLARKNYKDLTVISHPECHSEVIDKSDYAGSTSQMADFIRDSKSKRVMLLTECSMGDNLQSEFPDVEFISTCQTCPHMKKITLEKVKLALENEQFEVEVPEEIRVRAKKALDRMLEIGC